MSYEFPIEYIIIITEFDMVQSDLTTNKAVKISIQLMVEGKFVLYFYITVENVYRLECESYTFSEECSDPSTLSRNSVVCLIDTNGIFVKPVIDNNYEVFMTQIDAVSIHTKLKDIYQPYTYFEDYEDSSQLFDKIFKHIIAHLPSRIGIKNFNIFASLF